MRVLSAVVVFSLAASIAIAQPSQSLPRTPDGHVDFQGIYDIATMTPLEREAGTPLVMTKEEAARLEKVRADRVTRAAQPSDGNRNAPPAGGDGSAGAAGNVGGYNNFWIDNGTEYFSIDGQKRMSVIVDPPDGRIPELTPAGKQRTARFARQTSDAQESDPGFEALMVSPPLAKWNFTALVFSADSSEARRIAPSRLARSSVTSLSLPRGMTLS